ncbi:hypothetical protein L7F22_052528 [Adiantum nelumboides]|nr:hypothetical protein [Adiantum nelumboides]
MAVASSIAHPVRGLNTGRIARDIQIFGSSQDWKAVCEGKRLPEGLQAAVRTLNKGKPLSREVAYCLLQGCSKNKDLRAGKLVLSLITRSNLELVAPLGDPLIRLFAAHGQLPAAYQVFSSIPKPGSHSWHAIISAHVSLQEHKKSLTLYCRMLDCGILPSKFLFSCILKACASTEALGPGMLLHDQIIESTLETDVVVGSVLIGLYTRCGCLEESRRVFDHLKLRNVVSCNTLMSGYAQQGENRLAWELFEKMQRDGIQPDHFTFSCILKTCGSSKAVNQGVHVHKLISEQGFSSDVVVQNALMDMYFKCGNVAKAQEVFDEMSEKDVVSWNTLFMGYSSYALDFNALMSFERMQRENTIATRVTYLCILKACCNLNATREGRWVHDRIIKDGLVTAIEVGSAVVLMYAQCGCLADAHCVFDILSDKDDVLWCTMITAYAEGGCPLSALELYERMRNDNVTLDNATFVCILKACALLKAFSYGKLVHEHVSLCGLEYDVAVRNSLINMYVKCGRLDLAVELFKDFSNRSLVSWNAMMTGYTQNEPGFPALELFEKMLAEGFKPDNVSFLCALKASACSGALLQGRLIHDLVSRGGIGLDTELQLNLINMYVKCGSFEEACRVFDLSREKNFSWGILTSGYAQKGGGSLAVQHVDYLQTQGLKPDSTTDTSMLLADNEAGQSKESSRQFSLVTNDAQSVSSLENYNCIIDNLGRTGCVYEAERLLRTLPFSPDIFGWMSLLTACRTYGYSKLGRQCRDKIVSLQADSTSTLQLASRLFGE